MREAASLPGRHIGQVSRLSAHTSIAIEIDDHDAMTGTVRVGRGGMEPFEGWLTLLAVLERAIERGRAERPDGH